MVEGMKKETKKPRAGFRQQAESISVQGNGLLR
jgi:hypothetical protein